MAPDLFHSAAAVRLEFPNDVCEAILCVIEEGLEVVLPVGGRVSCGLGEAWRRRSCRGHRCLGRGNAERREMKRENSGARVGLRPGAGRGARVGRRRRREREGVSDEDRAEQSGRSASSSHAQATTPTLAPASARFPTRPPRGSPLRPPSRSPLHNSSLSSPTLACFAALAHNCTRPPTPATHLGQDHC